MARPIHLHVGQWLRRLAMCVGLLGALASLIVGCSGGHSGQPLPRLRLPGVKQLPALQTVANYPPDQAYGIAAYQPGGLTNLTGEATIRFIVNTSAGVYDEGIDGTVGRLLEPRFFCSRDELTVTRTGSWAACSTSQGIEVFAPDAIPPDPGHIVLPLDEPEGEPPSTFAYASRPAWQADGSHLVMYVSPAMVASQGGVSSAVKPCYVGIYSIDPSAIALKATAFLHLPLDTSQCEWLGDLALSPDGSRLSFTWYDVNDPETLTELDLATLTPSPYGHESAPVTIDVQQNQLTSLITPVFDPQWEPGAPSTLTFLSGSATIDSIVKANLATHTRDALVTLGDDSARLGGYICGHTWTPDGARVIFAYCGPSNEEVLGPPAQIYVYTPVS